MANKKIYCVYCGTKNNIEDLKCKKCKKKLNPKNHLFKEFLVDHIKDDLQGNVEDTVIELIRKWIISHLYGIGIFSAVVFTGSVIITKEITMHKYDTSFHSVNDSFEIIDTCKNKETIDKELVCEDGFNLVDDQCEKVHSTNVKEYITCDDGFTLIGDSCISNYNIDLTKNVSCTYTPVQNYWSIDNDYIISSWAEGDTCYINYCEPVGTVIIDGNCPRPIQIETVANISYYCSGYTDYNGNCKTYGQRYFHSTCDEGELVDNHCEIKEVKSPSVECPTGTIFDSKCSLCIKEDS